MAVCYEGVPSDAGTTLPLIELQRKAVGIGKEGEAFARMFVDPDRLDNDPVALQVLNDWLESSNRECEMAQPLRLRLRGPCRRVWEREELDLSRAYL